MANHNDRSKALALAVAADVPVLIWGAPGEGKTAVVEQIGEHAGMHVETVIASLGEPSDFKGLPVVVDGRVSYHAPDWAQNVADNGGGLVFFDEISTAPPSTQAALLRTVLDKVVGSLRLPGNTRFVAAANPPEIAADGWDLSAPLANRFLHLDWDVDAGTIADGFSFGFKPIDIPTVDQDKVAESVAATMGTVGAFLNARPELKSQMPNSSTEAGKAWPSPRSWEMGAKVLGFARAAGADDTVQSLLLGGAIGGAAAIEFLNWEQNLDLPDIEKALKDGKIDVPERADKVYAVVGGITRALLSNPTKARMDVGVNKLLVQIAEAGHRDLAVVALRQVAPTVQSSGAVLTPAAVKHFGDMLAAMGKIGK